MKSVVVRTEQLGKRYRIHQARRTRAAQPTLGETLVATVKSHFVNLIGDGNTDVARSTDKSTIWALRDISFELHEGEVLGVIGRNGAGKSTLLKILSRITEPTQGRVEIRGRVASPRVEGPGAHPELTGRENIYLNGAVLGRKKAEIDRKFDQI